MKIGLISFHSLLNPGGVKRHVFGLHKEFERRGIQSKIIAPRRKRHEFYGKDVILLGTSFPLNFSGSQSDFDVNFNPLAIERVMRKEKFDVLHFHNFGLPSAWQILERSRALNILTIHANISKSKFFKKFPMIFYLMRKIVEWKIDGVIGVASLNLNFKNSEDFEKPGIVIPNGIDLKEFNPQVSSVRKFSISKGADNKINILFVGRIEERKGLIYLLKAFKVLTKNLGRKRVASNLRLIIVGEGPLKKDCQRYVKENNLKEVYFEGEITGKKLPSYYRSSDIFVSPATFGESFGLVLLEAMACGVPVVAFANQGYKEFLKGKREEKFLVKPKDYKSLAEKIEILIKNKELRKEIGKCGIKEAQEYSWLKIADQVLDFYKLCLKEKQKRKKINSFPFGETIDKVFVKIFKKLYYKDVLNQLKRK